MAYLFDSSAWIECLFGTTRGRPINKMLEEKKIITLEPTLAEIHAFCLREHMNFNEVLLCIEEASEITPVDRHVWIDTAKTRAEMRKQTKDVGLMDALLLTFAQEHGHRVITTDPHFKSWSEAIVF